MALNWFDFHARQYDPALGRFLSIDPMDQFASGYVGMGNNPINGIDPDGRFFGTLAGAMIPGAVLGAGGGYLAGRAAGLEGHQLGYATVGGMLAGAGIAAGFQTGAFAKISSRAGSMLAKPPGALDQGLAASQNLTASINTSVSLIDQNFRFKKVNLGLNNAGEMLIHNARKAYDVYRGQIGSPDYIYKHDIIDMNTELSNYGILDGFAGTFANITDGFRNIAGTKYKITIAYSDYYSKSLGARTYDPNTLDNAIDSKPTTEVINLSGGRTKIGSRVSYRLRINNGILLENTFILKKANQAQKALNHLNNLYRYLDGKNNSLIFSTPYPY